MAVFEVFARERRELTKSEVARLLDLPESSTSDLLSTLYEIGYLSRTATTRRFYPTGRLLSMASAIAENDALTSFGVEATGLLAQRTEETSCCAVLTEDGIKLIAVTQGRHRLRYVIEVGERSTMHATALGKAILGELDDAEAGRRLRLRPLPRRTPQTKTDPRELEREIREHRELGWYQAVDEGSVGVSSLGVPGRIGDQIVALNVVGPTDRIQANRDQLTATLREVQAVVFAP